MLLGGGGSKRRARERERERRDGKNQNKIKNMISQDGCPACKESFGKEGE